MIHDLIADVASAYGVSLRDLYGERAKSEQAKAKTRKRKKMFTVRSRAAVAARIEIYRVLRRLGWSYPKIGKALGVDHSTVIYRLRGA